MRFTTVPLGSTTTASTTSTTVADEGTTSTSTTVPEETAGLGTLPYTGSPIDGGSFPRLDLVLLGVGLVLTLSGAGILVSHWAG